MNDTALHTRLQEIVVDQVFPHAPEVIWKTLTTGALIARWLPMPSSGFEPVVGHRFTYQTMPAGKWDGTIRCEVLEVIPNTRLAYAWRGGHEENEGYGSKLDTVVTFTLERTEGGTRLRLVHSGFVMPRNETAYRGMSGGWSQVVATIGTIAAGQASSQEDDHAG